VGVDVVVPGPGAYGVGVPAPDEVVATVAAEELVGVAATVEVVGPALANEVVLATQAVYLVRGVRAPEEVVFVGARDYLGVCRQGDLGGF
jgi:hypothetical protein